MVCGMNRRLRKACVGAEALAGVASSRQGSKHLPKASPSGLVDMLARFGDFARHRLAPKYVGPDSLRPPFCGAAISTHWRSWKYSLEVLFPPLATHLALFDPCRHGWG